MRHARVYGIAGLAVLAIAAVAFAQTTVTPLPDNAPVQTAPIDATAVSALAKARPGDAKAGATKAGTCAACHGLDGNGTDPALYPRLAGQSERYVAHQLALFKSGERVNAIMQPYAAPLTAQDMRDLGAYFATQKSGAGVADDTVIASGSNAGMKFYAVGETLFRSGDAARGIPACMACHGPAGAGNPGPAYPRLSGQMADYSERRLIEYREGIHNRKDAALFNVMHEVAQNLTDVEIQSLSTYLQGLHDRADDAAATGAAPAAAPAAAAASAPAPASPAAPEPAAEPAPRQS